MELFFFNSIYVLLLVPKSTNTDERVEESSIKELRAEIDQLRYSVLLALLVQKYKY